MSVNWELFIPSRGLGSILICQLIISVSCFYGAYKFQDLYDVRIEKIHQFELKLSEIQCDQINKNAVLQAVQSSGNEPKQYSNLLFWFGMVLVGSVGLTLIDVYRSKKKQSTQM